MAKKKQAGHAVIVCCGTNGRAVLYGRCDGEPVAGQPIRLKGARMVLYWSQACGGLLGLAANGPKKGTRITAAVAEHGDECARQWVSVSGAAAKAIESWPAC